MSLSHSKYIYIYILHYIYIYICIHEPCTNLDSKLRRIATLRACQHSHWSMFPSKFFDLRPCSSASDESWLGFRPFHPGGDQGYAFRWTMHSSSSRSGARRSLPTPSSSPTSSKACRMSVAKQLRPGEMSVLRSPGCFDVLLMAYGTPSSFARMPMSRVRS